MLSTDTAAAVTCRDNQRVQFQSSFYQRKRLALPRHTLDKLHTRQIGEEKRCNSDKKKTAACFVFGALVSHRIVRATRHVPADVYLVVSRVQPLLAFSVGNAQLPRARERELHHLARTLSLMI